jgi:hypothetical protein
MWQYKRVKTECNKAFTKYSKNWILMELFTLLQWEWKHYSNKTIISENDFEENNPINYFIFYSVTSDTSDISYIMKTRWKW